MIFYVLVYLLYFGVSIYSEKVNRKLLYFILFFISAFRFDVGFDFPSYYKLVFDLERSQRIEFLYRKLLKLSYLLKEPQLIFILTSLISILLLYNILKNTKYENTMILYYLCFFYLNSLTAQRYMLAYLLVCYGYKYIEEKKLKQYLIIILIAFFIHKLALLGIVFYFFNIKLSRKMQVIYFFLMILAGNLMIKIIKKLGIYANYFSEENSTGKKMIIIFIFLGVIFLILEKKMSKKNKNVITLINVYLFTLGLNIIFLNFSSAGIRLGQLGYLYTIYLIPSFIDIFKNKNIIKIFLGVFGGIIWFLTIYLGDKNESKKIYTPYKLIFFVNEIKFKGE